MTYYFQHDIVSCIKSSEADQIMKAGAIGEGWPSGLSIGLSLTFTFSPVYYKEKDCNLAIS